MSALLYNSIFDASATATNTLTVLGETSIGQTSDQEIVVYVPLSALKASLLHDASWTRPAKDVLEANNCPEVTFVLSALTSAMKKDTSAPTPLSAEDRFLAKYSSGKDSSFDDDASLTKQAMQRWVMEAAPMADSIIETIPFEAIVEVNAGGITATALNTLDDPAASNFHTSDVMNLFEQALAAGKLNKEAIQGSSNKCDNFLVGDSITVYVRYAVTRTTDVKLDSDNATAGVPKFKLNGVEYESMHEVGVATDKVVAYKFVADASA